MANVFNIAKNKIAAGTAAFTTADKFYCSLWTATSAFPIAGTNLDFDTITALEADASWAEATGGGYARDQLGTGVLPAIDDTNDRQQIQFPKATFAAISAGQTIVAALIVWQATPATPSDGSDAPFAAYDVTDTPTNGGTIEIRWNATDGTGDAIYLT